MNHLPDVLPFVSILTLISCKRKVDAYKKTINSVANMAVSMKNPKKQKPLDPAAVCGHRDPAAVRELLTKVRDKWSIFLIAPTRQWDTPRCRDGTASCTGMGRSRSLCHHQNDQDKGRRARSCHTEGVCPNRRAPGLCCVSWSARALHGLPAHLRRHPTREVLGDLRAESVDSWDQQLVGDARRRMSNVDFEVSGAVAVLRLDNPPVNSLGHELRRSI